MESDGSNGIGSAVVVGLGLMGGSLARDLAARGVRVFGWETDRARLRAAVEAGIVEEGYGHPVDVVVLAGPVLTIPSLLRVVLDTLEPHLDAVRLVTDLGSTKSSIIRAAEEMGIGDRFVGSHPLAGDHRSGWDASRAGLYADARVFLSPTRQTTDDAMRLASALWAGVGARPEVIDADLHDVRMAWRSHLPQVVSTALGLTIAQTGSVPADLGPGGRDVTRLAGSSPEMWADILLDNADALNSALAMMGVHLKDLHQAIVDGDRARLMRLLTEARNWHREGRDPVS